MFYSTRDDRTEREKQLERELEDARRREEERREEEQREWERRNKEIKQRVEDSYRQATTWPEALSNQAHLCRRESNLHAKLDREYGLEPEPDDFFGPAADACDKALEYWRKESEKTADEIAALEEKIAQLRAGIADRVADRLEAHEDMPVGWYSVVGALREYDESNLDAWLWW